MDLEARVGHAVGKIRERYAGTPEIAIILGTGLGAVEGMVENAVTIDYDDLPDFPRSTVVGHAGQVTLGTLCGREVVVWHGRFHYYEGYSMEDVGMTVRVSRALGAGTLIVSNACGGLNFRHEKGDIVLIEDHIGLLAPNPLVGPNDDEVGPRFPDMCEPYAKDLLELAERIALEERIRVHRGVYVYVTGPTLETRAEYRFLTAMGADVVGMSTVPEVVFAVHCGMKVLGLSCVTDLCLADALAPVKIEEILEAAQAGGEKLCRIVRRVAEEMPR